MISVSKGYWQHVRINGVAAFSKAEIWKFEKEIKEIWACMSESVNSQEIGKREMQGAHR